MFHFRHYSSNALCIGLNTAMSKYIVGDMMNDFENQKFCQSCAMPLTDELFGTNADGTKNEDYCMYCFNDGEFTSDMSMEEMMNFCIEKMVEVHPEMDKNQASAMMREVFPKLKRWANE